MVSIIIKVITMKQNRPILTYTFDTDQGTCILLTLIRAPAGYQYTPDTGQDMREERAHALNQRLLIKISH